MNVIQQRLKWLLGVCVIQTLFMLSFGANAQEHPLAWMECKQQRIYSNTRYEKASAWYNDLHRPRYQNNINTTSWDFNHAYTDLLGVDPFTHNLSKESKRLYCESKKKFYEGLLEDYKFTMSEYRNRPFNNTDSFNRGPINFMRRAGSGPTQETGSGMIGVTITGGGGVSITIHAALLVYAIVDMMRDTDIIEVTCADIYNDPEAYSRCLKKVREQLDMTEEEYIARKRQLPKCEGCREE